VTRPKDRNQGIIDEFRNTGGKVGGPFEGAPLLLLHTQGAKTGQERVHPMMYQALEGENVAVFGSKGGAPSHPHWYYNLLANPKVIVEIGTVTRSMTARVSTAEEREHIWARQKRDYPGFAEYEKKTSRQIPVVILEPTLPEKS
jgi:deazaflavin-dependent oxidoreductase (nitroreductase family)